MEAHSKVSMWLEEAEIPPPPTQPSKKKSESEEVKTANAEGVSPSDRSRSKNRAGTPPREVGDEERGKLVKNDSIGLPPLGKQAPKQPHADTSLLQRRMRNRMSLDSNGAGEKPTDALASPQSGGGAAISPSSGNADLSVEQQLSALKQRRLEREKVLFEPKEVPQPQQQKEPVDAAAVAEPPTPPTANPRGKFVSGANNIPPAPPPSKAPAARPSRSGADNSALVAAAVNDICSANWELQAKGMEKLKSFLNSTVDASELEVVMMHTKRLVLGLVDLCDNGRSSVAKAAIEAMGAVCKLGSRKVGTLVKSAGSPGRGAQNVPVPIDGFAEVIALKLIGRGGSTSKFLYDSALYAVRELVTSLPTTKALQMLVSLGTPRTEKSKVIWGEAVAHGMDQALPGSLHVPTVSKDPTSCIGSLLSKVVLVIDVLVHDGAPDVRESGRTVSARLTNYVKASNEAVAPAGKISLENIIRFSLSSQINIERVMSVCGIEPSGPSPAKSANRDKEDTDDSLEIPRIPTPPPPSSGKESSEEAVGNSKPQPKRKNSDALDVAPIPRKRSPVWDRRQSQNKPWNKPPQLKTPPESDDQETSAQKPNKVPAVKSQQVHHGHRASGKEKAPASPLAKQPSKESRKGTPPPKPAEKVEGKQPPPHSKKRTPPQSPSNGESEEATAPKNGLKQKRLSGEGMPPTVPKMPGSLTDSLSPPATPPGPFPPTEGLQPFSRRSAEAQHIPAPPPLPNSAPASARGFALEKPPTPLTPQTARLQSTLPAASLTMDSTLTKELLAHGAYSRPLFLTSEGNFTERCEALEKIRRLLEDHGIKLAKGNEKKIEVATALALCDAIALRCSDSNNYVREEALQTVAPLMKVIDSEIVNETASKWISCITTAMSFSTHSELAPPALRAVVHSCPPTRTLLETLTYMSISTTNVVAKGVLVSLLTQVLLKAVRNNTLTGSLARRPSMAELKAQACIGTNEAMYLFRLGLKLMSDTREPIRRKTGQLLRTLHRHLLGDKMLNYQDMSPVQAAELKALLDEEDKSADDDDEEETVTPTAL